MNIKQWRYYDYVFYTGMVVLACLYITIIYTLLTGGTLR